MWQHEAQRHRNSTRVILLLLCYNSALLIQIAVVVIFGMESFGLFGELNPASDRYDISKWGFTVILLNVHKPFQGKYIFFAVVVHFSSTILSDSILYVHIFRVASSSGLKTD